MISRRDFLRLFARFAATGAATLGYASGVEAGARRPARVLGLHRRPGGSKCHRNRWGAVEGG